MLLSKLTIVNTRPAHQAKTLNQLLSALGVSVINFPTLDIQPFNVTQTKKWCRQLDQFDFIIFLSANAVLYSDDYWPTPFPIKTIIAIGPGTQKALHQKGIPSVYLPKHFNSEGILMLPEFTNAFHKKVIIFCGKNPRPLLQKSLSEKTATTVTCECYQRVCPTPNLKTLDDLQSKKQGVIISTSKESLVNLNTLVKKHPTIKKLPLIVISDAMKMLAKNQNWQQVITAENASNEAIVETLKNIT